MFRWCLKTKLLFPAVFCLLATLLLLPGATRTSLADDVTGHTILSMARVAHGAGEFKGLQYVTARSTGFVNVAPIAGVGLGTGSAVAAVEIKLNLTDYQDVDGRRRLDASPGGNVMIPGPTFLVYTGTEGGGMYQGVPYRVSEVTATRHWGLMGFSTLNRAVDRQLTTVRQRDEGNNFVVEVKFTPQDTIRYWIDKDTFLINRVVTRYNSRVIVEEDRSDYRKVSCMMLPFRIVTRLGGQRLADLSVDSYDLQTAVPSARFTLTAVQ